MQRKYLIKRITKPFHKNMKTFKALIKQPICIKLRNVGHSKIKAAQKKNR